MPHAADIAKGSYILAWLGGTNYVSSSSAQQVIVDQWSVRRSGPLAPLDRAVLVYRAMIGAEMR